MKKNKTTIHDISNSLGINSSTVSRALNDSPLISQKTKDKILARAKKLGYQRNFLASKLRNNRSRTIGVIVPRISRYFFSAVIAGIEETAFNAGYDVIICQSLESFEREKKLVETLSSNQVDGILVSISWETKTADHFKNYQQHDHPVIFFDRPFNTTKNTHVIIDDFKAGFDATEHLINNGCKDIVHFTGPQNLELYQRRMAGYKAALEKHQIQIRESYIFESYLMESDGKECAKKIMKLPKVDAVFSANDTSSIAAMQYLKSKNVKIPDDIAFVGFSNEPASSVIEPALTTISQADFEMGKTATSLLLEQIKFPKKIHQNQTTVLSPQLIIRESSQKI